MDPTTESRRELGVRVRQRRLRLGLSIGKAAKEAPMSPTTWSRVEHGGKVRELAYTSIDAVLQWRAGSSERFLADGEEPQPVDSVEPGPAGGDGASPQSRRGASPARATASGGAAPRIPRQPKPSLAVGEVREWRVVPTSDPDPEETTVVFWIGPADVDMEEVGRAFDEQRRLRPPSREAEAIAEQDRWEALIARENAEAVRAGSAENPGEVDRNAGE
ncbi:helix-turn-helix domain-containing protein [Spirillospora sp. CA-255316]